MADSSFQRAHGALMHDVGASFRSNTLDNEFMSKLILGGMISPENKDNVRSTLDSHNRAGGRGYSRLQYLNFNSKLPGNEQLGWLVSASTDYHLKLDFPGQLYHLLFEGNADFVGETMGISSLGAEYFAYQKLGFGAFNKKNLSWATISFVNGQDYVRSAATGELFTSEIGDSLALNYAAFLERSDPDVSGIGSSNGAGFALDASVNVPFGDGTGFVRLELADVGGLWWNDQSIRYESIDSLQYTGVEISDILNDALADLSIPNFEDSITFTEERGKLFSWLSGSYTASVMSRQESGNYLELGVRMKFDNTALPMVYGSYHYMLDDNTSVFARATLGGYGRLRLGAGFEKYWKGWYISAQTGDLPGLILNDLRGRGAWFSFGRFFKTQ